MGAKASTANSDEASSRDRSYSTGSASDVVTSGGAFSLLRAIPNLTSSDRQRARSLSSVPDSNGGQSMDDSRIDDDTLESLNLNSSEAHILENPLANLNIGRMLAARTLSSHIISINGIKCPVCSKFVLPDDVECHLVICLTKPRLLYNEDVLSADKGECVICLEELVQGDTIARLPCLCIYHKGCIDQWFDVNRSCPEHPGD